MADLKRRELTLPGQTLPPSIPLIIYKNYEWNQGECQLEKEGDNKHSGDTDSQRSPLKVVKEALEVLSTINKPIAILSVCGPFRTGKSYLLSRILGIPGTFKVGHSMSACTRGVWMATTILECDEYAVLFLDTEGIDSVDGDEEGDSSDDFINKLLIVTTLISTLLIYNSTTVPDWTDLEYLSCFSQLSSSIETKSMEEYDNISKSFPDLLWLIRDVLLKLPIDNGKQMSPTEYLMKNVLIRSNNDASTREDYVVNAILHLFPSIECRTLPRPSVDSKIVISMEENHEQLDEKFKSELQVLIDYVLKKVSVKPSSNMCCSNGSLWSELVTRFVSLVNRDDKLELGNTYIMAAEAALSKLSHKLVHDYKRKMEKSLEGKYPIEEYEVTSDGAQQETLLSIHEKVFNPIRESFQQEIDRLLSVKNQGNVLVQEKRSGILSSFMNEICRLSNAESILTIEGGVLHRFAIENKKASRRYCRKMALEAFRDFRRKIQAAGREQTKVDESDVKEAERLYYETAVGPARDEVYVEIREDLEDSAKELVQTIPGRPLKPCSTGKDKNRIKLQWVGTGTINYYKIRKMHGDENWLDLPDNYPNEFAVIENLESNTEYMFQVCGVGITGVYGEWSDTCKCSTTLSSLARGAATLATFMGGLAVVPVGAVAGLPVGGPIFTVGGLVGAPVIAGMWAKKMAEYCGPKGDLKKSLSHNVSHDTVHFQVDKNSKTVSFKESHANISQSVSITNEEMT